MREVYVQHDVDESEAYASACGVVWLSKCARAMMRTTYGFEAVYFSQPAQ